MITIPIWLLMVLFGAVGFLALSLLHALVKREELADRRLARDLRPGPVNPQKAEDQGGDS